MTGRHRIGFLSGDYLDFGGVETHLLSIFQKLDNACFESLLIAPASEKFIYRAEDAGVRHIPWAAKNTTRLEKICSLQSIFREQKISLVHIHSPGISIEGRLAAWLTRLPALVTIHLQPSDYFSNVTAKQKAKFLLYSLFDCLLNYTLTEETIYVSSCVYTKSLAWKYVPRKRAVLIPNGVDLSLAQSHKKNIQNRLEITKERIIACFVGRLEPQKGLQTLFQAIRMIPETVLAELELWIIGTGSLSRELETLAKSIGLQKHIRFLGYQENPGNYLQEADIFVLPSHYEAMSISLLEAMAYGLPCIVTKTGENSRLIKHGVDGLVFPAGDAQLLSTFLETLVTDSALRQQMGCSVRAKSAVFSNVDMIRQLTNIYCTVLQNQCSN